MVYPYDRDINIQGWVLMAQVQGLAVDKSPADMFIDSKQKTMCINWASCGYDQRMKKLQDGITILQKF